MHYANGRAAKIGDLVRGKGYNVKHEIVGVLTSANPGATACNATVAHVDHKAQFVAFGWRTSSTDSPNAKAGEIAFPSLQLADGSWKTVPSQVIASLEYGQLDAFVALDPATGEVLPPEDQAQPEQSA